MNKIAVNYKVGLKHEREKIDAWKESTLASKDSQLYILNEWRRGTVSLLIPRDKFMEIVKNTK